MMGIAEYKHLYCKNVTVFLANGSTVTGYWSEWFSAEDNAWDEDNPDERSESILIDPANDGPIEIQASDIQRIEAA
jgi:hypothetical protein